MILLAFSLFDTKTGSYGQPFFFNHQVAAQRALRDLLADPSTLPARYPGDYQLHQLAMFNDATGEFHSGFENLGSLVPFVPQPAVPPLLQRMQASGDAIEPVPQRTEA